MKKLTLNVVRGSFIYIAISLGCLFPSIASAEEIKITGSTTFAPLVAALSESFMTNNPSIKINFTQSNAADSINSVIDGQVDIGCSARYLRISESGKAEAKGMKLTCHSVALDCIFPIVHPSNNIKSLGLGQIESIFKGKILNWKELDNGINSTINVINRETGSAMYEFWQEKVMHDASIASGSKMLQSNQDIINMVSSDQSAIGYTSFNYLSEKVKVVPITGLEAIKVPTETHPLSRKLLMCTNGNPSKTVQQFVDFIAGPDGKSVMQKAGYLPY
jgi:phosphate transport system substrate-binding protein